MPNEMRAPRHISELIKLHQLADGACRRLGYIFDSKYSSAEMDHFNRHNATRQAALSKLCAWPCPDFAALRSKIGYLNRLLGEDGETLGADNLRRLFSSILAIPKGERHFREGE